MTYTQNHHLPQWEKSDPVKMSDFNQMCCNIDSGLAETKKTADAARTAAAEKPYVVGTYTGTTAFLQVDIGFKPSFLIICRLLTGTSVEDVRDACWCAAGDGIYQKVHFNENGFEIYIEMPSLPYPHLNLSKQVYHYIAFR